jgi:hypothetical protein
MWFAGELKRVIDGELELKNEALFFPRGLAGEVPENYGMQEVTCVSMIFPNFNNAL